MALNSHHKTVTSLCFCMNHKRLVSASLDRSVIVNCEYIIDVLLLIFTALHAMQMRSSDKNSFRPSVRPSHA